MNILMISPVHPYPSNSGGKVRIKYIYEGLKKYHDVVLITPTTSIRDANGYESQYFNSRVTKQNKIRSNLSFHPYHYELWYDKFLKNRIIQESEKSKCDLIYCHFIYTVPYVLSMNLPILVDQQNVDRVYWLRKANAYFEKTKIIEAIISKLNYYKVIHFENKVIPYVKGVICVSTSDKNKMVALYGEKNNVDFIVAPNGVDTSHFQPQVHRLRNNDSINIGFLGSLDLEANLDAVNTLYAEIFPRVKECFPNKKINIMIVGKNPPRYLVELSKTNTNIIVTGFVPDVLPYLHQVDIMVLPLKHGAGTKLRVFEAAATGIPIVATGLALDGISHFYPGVHYCLGNTIDELVSEICSLVENPEKRLNIASEALKIISSEYDWVNITKDLAREISKYKG